MSVKIPFAEVKETIQKALINAGLPEETAELCAQIHAESSADGVESHGCNRVPRFVDYVRRGWVNPKGTPSIVTARGFAENYDGNLGPGISNAVFCSDRAVELAKEHGIGMVTLKNATHWMRGGTYAWRMAQNGYLGISWIVTESCMPMWGSDEKSVGNNPFCMAVPREDGEIVLDMAMSQYAYGKLGVYRLAGKQLPYPGGFDKDGNLTTDPGAIEETMRILPTGYWKGSSFAIILDLVGAALAGGITGADQDDAGKGSCTSSVQVFIAIDPYLFSSKEEVQEKWNRRVERVHQAHPVDEKRPVSCPGENTIKRRESSMKNGVSVDEQIWMQIQKIAAGDLEIMDISSK